VEAVEAVCEELAAQQHLIDDAGLTVWPDGTSGGCYRFQHALYQQVLYEQVGSARRVQLHRRIGARLEAGYGARAGEIAAQLAVHFERGGETSQAVHYWQQAGDNAARRNAHHDASAILTKGLALLATLPESPERARHELTLQLALGASVVATKGLGAPEGHRVYTRAHALSQQVGDPGQRFQALHGLYRYYGIQAELRTAAALAEQLLELAHRQPDATLCLVAEHALGTARFFLGEPVTAQPHLEQSLRLYRVAQHHPFAFLGGFDPGVIGGIIGALTLWSVGYADQAWQRMHAALALAHQVAHAPSLAHAESLAAILAQCCRDVPAVQGHADALQALGVEYGWAHRLERARLLHGWVLAMQGEAARGVAQIRQGVAATQGGGLKLLHPYFLALLAEAYGQDLQPEAGLQVLAEAVTLMATTEERWWEAEVYRLQGELLRQLPRPEVCQAEACVRHALDVARGQQARSLELRAALSLGRLWQQQGKRKRAEAHQLLAEIYGWFTEGFDTPDLRDARALLEAAEGPLGTIARPTR
jgi:predicted ATPase